MSRPRLPARGLGFVASRPFLAFLQRIPRGSCTGGAPLPPRAPLRSFGPAFINYAVKQPPGLTRRAVDSHSFAVLATDAHG